MKRLAWDKIEVDFNAEASAKKSQAQLKILWKDLKAKAKKAISKNKREMIKTGGGEKEPDLDESTKIITDLIPQVFESLSNVGDDDNEEYHYSYESNETIDEPSKVTGRGESENCGKSELTAQKVNVQNNEAGSSRSSTLDNRADSRWNKKKPNRKETIHSFVTKSATEFHLLKVNLLKEEHHAKITLIERQREMAEEEHRLKMGILRKVFNNVTENTQMSEEHVIDVSGEQVFNISNLQNLGQLITGQDNVFNLAPL